MYRRTTHRSPVASLLAGACVAMAFAAPSASARVPEIPFETFSLDNGLEVVLSRDTSVPTVHTEIWYKVGSKDEEPGKTGFAHLFEHIMFQGTKHVPEDAHFKFLQEAGASNVNGTTSFDRTNYYETLPANRLELAMWLESSRMGYLLARPSFKETLDNQRDVVKNERRQRVENRPMGAVMEEQLENLFPTDHPYHHEVIGSMDDLTAASVDDIKGFFNRYYAPNNAILVIAGSFDTAATKALVQKYFGPIPAAPPIVRRPAPKFEFKGPKTIEMEAKVKLPTAFLTWQSVPMYQPGDAEMDVLAAILTDGKTSRLHKRLVYDLKVAQQVEASQWSLMHAGLFEISVTPLPGKTLKDVLPLIDEELARLASTPVDVAEVERVKNKIKTNFFSGLEQVSGVAGLLAQYKYFTGDPGFIGRDLARYEAVTPASLQSFARNLLRKDRRLTVTVTPNDQAPIMGRVKR
ncbi:MAG: pitrilysin family protein [Deltaproteobacteria bacterium]|nr:pitrilysin family protein [Deltaproteobacteria bacterium]